MELVVALLDASVLSIFKRHFNHSRFHFRGDLILDTRLASGLVRESLDTVFVVRYFDIVKKLVGNTNDAAGGKHS